MQYFKYLSPQRIDVLENLKIRYTQAIALNDPFEVFPAIIDKGEDWYYKQFLARIEAEAEQFAFRSAVKKKQFLRARKKEFPNFYRCYTDEPWLMEQAYSIVMLDAHVQGYLSLSKTNKNILMWSHYAQSHEGFVIGFNSQHSYFNFGVSEIEYSEKRPFLNPLQGRQDASLFRTKSIDWAYEQEVRKSMEFVKRRPIGNGNTFLPYPEVLPDHADEIYKKVRLFDFPKDAISSLVFGWKSTNELRRSLVHLLEFHGLSSVKVMQAVPHSRKYEMVVEEI
ncbi:hypothetical protein WH06_22135 [Aeromonas salmonicida subsp. salmonicida]|uniref:DUF2971 domain-containing protein n=1 Tax=Aeromonas salmonicida subsp. salmonicida 01-B526 TaxID=1076135 RepID=A0ABP2MV39_AERSS|nr:hypothetical protein IYQ_21093 [Aeromonas salmonicida subsp. salmonicida 01-B526]KHE94994.1 hypothetical protein NV17_21160 [Aeromonas salmonicida subsp. salmonicida]KHE95594.1 hypothetical protein NX85_20875 [Aeromonas salmonicida subsp. salmonicida]KIX23284.1 hypothetical protein TM02_20775 [Aeromonas salmonicida subsp. salmonicida]KTA87139.1 hypothetical protein UC37_21780 [Aeromonas salmonicida subsp. salmonicida]